MISSSFTRSGILSAKLAALILAGILLASGATAFEGGSGSSDDPYQIATCQQLQDMQNDLSAYYELVEDVDCSGFIYSSVGDSSNQFTGVLDGQGYTVEKLEINEGSSDDVGLIGYLGSGGEVNDIGVVDVDITGEYFVGGLVGVNSGSVSQSYSKGSIGGSADEVGGLVGRNSGGSVSESFSTGSVSGSGNVGGLVGSNFDGSVSSSYSTGSVDGSGYRVGGLVGYNSGGSVSESFSTGSVSGWGNVGGLVGYNYDGSVSSGYWDVESSGRSDGIGYDNNGQSVTGLTTSEMQGGSAEENMLGLDFESVWVTTSSGYPELEWQQSGNGGVEEIPICDIRGPFNECISDSEHNISSKSFSISSIFEAKETSVFEAFYGMANINVGNSTSLSGFWSGSFNITTPEKERTTIEPGAEFKPENGRIIVR
jgi:hypothetical protein